MQTDRSVGQWQRADDEVRKNLPMDVKLVRRCGEATRALSGASLGRPEQADIWLSQLGDETI
jgi:hypothetical protein